MSILVQGRNVIAQIQVSGDFFPIFCAKSAVLNSVQEEVETTNVNSGPDREYVPGMRSHTMDVSGITQTDNSNSRVGILFLMQAAQRRQIFSMRWLLTDDDGNNVAILFTAFSTTLSIGRDIGTFSQSSAAFRISGAIAISEVIPDPVDPPCEAEDPLYLTGLETEASVSDPLLEADDVVILGVSRSGLVHAETTGTPGNLEFKFTGGSGNGTIAFDPTNPFNTGGEQVWVLYKIDA